MQAEERQKIIARYVQLSTSDRASEAEVQKHLKKLESYLTDIYWEDTQRIIDLLATKEVTGLSARERLTMDFGFVDEALVKDGADVESELLAETEQEGLPNCFYLTQWLGSRWHSFHLIQDIIKSADQPEETNASMDTVVLHKELDRLTKLRGDIYTKLAPFFEGIPGLNPAIVQSITSGNVDHQIQQLSMEVVHTGQVDALKKRNKLVSVRRNIVRTLGQKLKKHKFFPLVSALDGVANNIWQEHQRVERVEQRKLSRENSQSQSTPVQSVEDKKRDFFQGELNIVKSLMPIAAIEGKKFKTTPVLLNNRPRVLKEDVLKMWTIIETVDPRLPGSPDVLLAPCEGSGFFEWDRDTLFIPIHPTMAKEDCVINAVANYRIMMDMQGDRSIKQFYEKSGAKGNFKANFIRDYRQWVLKVHQGNKGSIKEDILEFFFTHIGPDTERIPGPRKLLNLSAIEQQEQLKSLLEKLKAKKITPRECFDLGILYWLTKRLDNAAKLMEMSLSMGLQDDMVLACLGFLSKQRGLPKAAAKYFRQCRERRGTTIWYLLAVRES